MLILLSGALRLGSTAFHDVLVRWTDMEISSVA